MGVHFKDRDRKSGFLRFQNAVYELFDMFDIQTREEVWEVSRMIEDEAVNQAMDYENDNFKEEQT